MKKHIILILITLLLSFSAVYADSPEEKLIESNLSKKMTTFQIKGGGIDSVKAYVRMFAPKYRLKTWTSSYNPKTKVTTFKVEYYTGNQNIATPDAVVKSEEELKKFLFDYTKGKIEHQVYLTTNNTLDPTTDQMFIIKLDYSVSDWDIVRKAIASIEFTWYSPYRLLLADIHTAYNHQYLPVTVNFHRSAEDKAYYDKYIGDVIKDIEATSKSPYEKIFKWFMYRENYHYDHDRVASSNYQGYLNTPIEERDAKFGDVFKDYVNTYSWENDKPLIEDKNGICYDFAQLTWYVLGELDIKVLCINDISIDHAWNSVDINGELWDLDYTNMEFFNMNLHPEGVYSKRRDQSTVVNVDIKTYEQFKQHFNIKE